MSIPDRIKREYCWIICLAVACVVVYGSYFLIKNANAKTEQGESAELIDVALAWTPTQICVEGQGESYCLYRGVSNWICKGKEYLPISHTLVTFCSITLQELTPLRIIENGADLFAQFGLETPQIVVDVSTDDDSRTYQIGNYNPLIDAYYMTVDDSETICIISGEDERLIAQKLLDLVSSPDITNLLPDEVMGAAVESNQWGLHYTAERNAEGFQIESDTGTFQTSEYRMLNVYSAFRSAEYSCAAYDVSAQEQANWGLEEPDLTVTLYLTEGRSAKLEIGTASDGNHYFCQDDSAIIYQISDSYYETIQNRVALETLSNEA